MSKSKIHTYGHEHESEWPPKYPTEPRGGHYYWDKEAQTFKEGSPPNPNNQFGVAPIAIFDSMPPEYHEGACRLVESRKEWAELDKAHGLLTFSSIAEPRKNIAKGIKQEAKELSQVRRTAAEEALKTVRANPREAHQKWQKHAEKQLETAEKSGLTPLLKEQGIL